MAKFETERMFMSFHRAVFLTLALLWLVPSAHTNAEPDADAGLCRR
jgi:hypothetical protein